MKIRFTKTSMGLAAAGGVAAITMVSPLIAHAATGNGSGTGAASGAAVPSPVAEGQAPGRGPRGPRPGGGETALTGTTAAKVTAAALAAVPGATVQRVTTEHAGAPNPYEAHLTKSDGSHVTVLISSSFTVMSIQAGPGPH